MHAMTQNRANCVDSPSMRRVDPSVREAIAWMVNLQAEDATPVEHAEFAKWYAASEANAAAWNRLSGSLGPLRVASEDHILPQGAVTRRVLDRHVSRRKLLRTTVAGGAAFAIVSGANRFIPLPQLRADHVTWTGQRTEIELEQGGKLTLGPRSAVNLIKGGDHDKIELVSGQVMLSLPEAERKPLRLAMGDWSFTPSHGRVVALDRGALRSASAIDAPMTIDIENLPSQRLKSREILVSDDGAYRVEAADPEAETAWTRGLLVVRDRLLSNVVEAVRPNFVGIIRITDEAARLRIGGVYELDHPVQIFEAMAETVPLQVRKITPFWISLDVASA